MENAKKMVLVPPEFFHRMNESKAPIYPSTENISEASSFPQSSYPTNNLDGDMNEIINKTNLNDREKWTEYYQILQRYFHQNKMQRQPVQLTINEGPVISNGMADQDIVTTYPPSLQKNAERLLGWIKRSNVNVSWDNQGVVKINGGLINGSNIIDLIGDLLRHRRTAIPPLGIETFIQVLRETNIPAELIGNKDRWRQYRVVQKNQIGHATPGSSRDTSQASTSQLTPSVQLPSNARLTSASQLRPSLQTSEQYGLRSNIKKGKKLKWVPYKHASDSSD